MRTSRKTADDDPDLSSPAAAEDAFRSLAPSVLGYLRGQGVDDPEDLLGDVFFQVSKSIGGFDGDGRALRRWVFTIAHNRVIDERRRRARRARRGSTVDAVPDLPAPDVEQHDPSLVAALVGLTDDQREVVTLRFVADLSLEDVAALTGRPLGAVKSMQHRALATLARSLGAHRLPGEP